MLLWCHNSQVDNVSCQLLKLFSIKKGTKILLVPKWRNYKYLSLMEFHCLCWMFGLQGRDCSTSNVNLIVCIWPLMFLVIVWNGVTYTKACWSKYCLHPFGRQQISPVTNSNGWLWVPVKKKFSLRSSSGLLVFSWYCSLDLCSLLGASSFYQVVCQEIYIFFSLL
jgi:hypothetical protein